MSPGVWIGNDIPEENKILIFGESHYGDKITVMRRFKKELIKRLLKDIQKCK